MYDGVGGDVARTLVGLLAPDGRHLVFGWSSQGIGDDRPYLVDGVSVSVLGPEMLRRGRRPRPDAHAGDARPRRGGRGPAHPAVQRFPLSRAADAHRALENRVTTGKVVLEP